MNKKSVYSVVTSSRVFSLCLQLSQRQSQWVDTSVPALVMISNDDLPMKSCIHTETLFICFSAVVDYSACLPRLKLLYIVAEDNNSISDDDISLYLKKIDTSVKTQLNLYVGEDEEENNQIKEALKYDDTKKRSKENVMKLLEIRYCLLKRAVKREITSLLKFDPLN